MPETSSLHDGLGDISHREASSQASERGFFLGASRDFWIVLFSCVGACLLGFVASLAAVELQTRRRAARSEEDGSESDDSDTRSDLLDPLLEKPRINPGFVQRVIFKAESYGGAFAFNADLALRASLVAFFCAATYFFPCLSWWQENGWEMSYVVVIVAFSFYLDLGTTNFLAWTGFYGTLLPVVNCWMMYGLFPDGVKVTHAQWDPSWAFVFGYVDFFLMVLLTCCLNFATNAKMFALSWQAYFTMCFINPEDRTHFSQGPFAVLLEDGATGALMGTIWGCVFAVLICILPTCVSALKGAQDGMLEVAWCHGRLLEHLVALGGVSMESQTSVVFAAEVRGLHQQVQKAKSLLESAWWECFGFGRSEKSRLLLMRLCESFDVLNDWLEAVIMSIQHSQNPSEGQQIFKAILPQLKELSQVTTTCLHRTTCVSVRGVLYDEEESLRVAMDAVAEAQASLAARFREEVAKFPPHQAFRTGDLTEFALAGSMSGYSQTVVELTLALIEEELPTSSFCCTCVKGILALAPSLEDLKSRPWHRETWKVCSTYLLCFFLGLWGLGSKEKFLPNYNSTPAGTVAYLIFQGGNEAAALKKNIDRFLGVGLGTMLGQLTLGSSCAFANFFQNTWIAQMFLPLYLIIEFASFYVYFGSPTFSYSGLLVACFFAEHALAKCGDLEPQSLSNYRNLLAQLMAIGCATLMDVLTDHSLSRRATANLEKFVQVFHEALSCFLPSTVSDVQQFREEGIALLKAARADGAEAAREPRVRGIPWRASLWGQVITVCAEAWQCLTILGCTATQGARQQLVIRKAGHVLLSSHHFVQQLEALKQRTQLGFDLTLNLMCQDSYSDANPVTRDLQQQLVQSPRVAVTAVGEIFADARKRMAREPVAQDLLQDEFCSVAMLLLMLEALAVRVARLETALLEQPEMWQLVSTQPLVHHDSQGS